MRRLVILSVAKNPDRDPSLRSAGKAGLNLTPRLKLIKHPVLPHEMLDKTLRVATRRQTKACVQRQGQGVGQLAPAGRRKLSAAVQERLGQVVIRQPHQMEVRQ